MYLAGLGGDAIPYYSVLPNDRSQSTHQSHAMLSIPKEGSVKINELLAFQLPRLKPNRKNLSHCPHFAAITASLDSWIWHTSS